MTNHPLLGYFKNKQSLVIGFDRADGSDTSSCSYLLPLYTNLESVGLFYFYCQLLLRFVGVNKNRVAGPAARSSVQ